MPFRNWNSEAAMETNLSSSSPHQPTINRHQQISINDYRRSPTAPRPASGDYSDVHHYAVSNCIQPDRSPERMSLTRGLRSAQLSVNSSSFCQIHRLKLFSRRSEKW